MDLTIEIYTSYSKGHRDERSSINGDGEISYRTRIPSDNGSLFRSPPFRLSAFSTRHDQVSPLKATRGPIRRSIFCVEGSTPEERSKLLRRRDTEDSVIYRSLIGRPEQKEGIGCYSRQTMGNGTVLLVLTAFLGTKNDAVRLMISI